MAKLFFFLTSLYRQSLYADAKSFFSKDTGVLEVPLTVQVADQVGSLILKVRISFRSAHFYI